MANRKPTYLLKLAILGDKQVGKTSLLARFEHDCFNPTYLHTKGGDITEKLIEQEKRSLKVTVIDSAGHKYVRSLIKTLYRDVHGIMLVFDVTNRNTFKALEKWMTEINVVNAGNPYIVVVANKTDLQEHSKVPSEEAAIYAARQDLDYIECSAKTGLNVTAAFDRLLERAAYNTVPAEPISTSIRLSNGGSKNDMATKKPCCGGS
ncbi:Ras-related protein Rab-34-like [Elysia marginata]|uniref:Ras-related protein Rab-34-like n=1 Tax=Elysia marginata TaxID=1093978 RepID=A0AAV4J2N7_9GAST|nr:Ras-related protein Rab-34-like [Elysia marginata]